MGANRGTQTHGGSQPGAQDDARGQLNGKGGQDDGNHLDEGQQPQKAGAVGSALVFQTGFQRTVIAAGQGSPDIGHIDSQQLYHQTDGEQQHKYHNGQGYGRRPAFLLLHRRFLLLWKYSDYTAKPEKVKNIKGNRQL